jgi:hypothetical protein
MAEAGDLIIAAHGRSHGLVDADGSTFTLPVAHPMPERIWLLACNVDGAMDDLAQNLLKQGCRTVIAATGDFSASDNGAVVESVCWQRRMHPTITARGWREQRPFQRQPAVPWR